MFAAGKVSNPCYYSGVVAKADLAQNGMAPRGVMQLKGEPLDQVASSHLPRQLRRPCPPYPTDLRFGPILNARVETRLSKAANWRPQVYAPSTPTNDMSKCAHSITWSGWSPPPPRQLNLGDLLYLRYDSILF